MSVLYIKTID